MIDKNTRNCNVVKRVLNIIVSIIAIIISQIISGKWFDGVLVWTLIIMVIILLILTPVGIIVDRKIETYYENKRES
ncbi:MAG: hypothetical protein ACI4A3_05195 [Lachnospiraceae bacterium]